MRKMPIDAYEPKAPYVVQAKRIRTLDNHGTVGASMVIADGYIRFIGSRDRAVTFATAIHTGVPQTVDLGDATVLPGFVDSHAHPLMLGQLMSWVDCGPEVATSIPEIVELLRATAETLPDGAPVRGHGFHQDLLVEGRRPTRFELDDVARDREVYLMHSSGHGGVVNSYALEQMGVDRSTPNPPGGEFFRDADGELTGELSDAACDYLTGEGGVRIGQHGPNFHLPDSHADLQNQLRDAQDAFLAVGVTTVGDAQVTRREFDTYLRLYEAGHLRLRVSMYLLSHLLDDLYNIGLHGQFGNARLSFAGLKLYAEGTLGGCTAYFPEGYRTDPHRTGQLNHDPATFAELILKAHRMGLQTATHAHTPTAVGLLLDSVSRALRLHPAEDSRHRIEHCGLPTLEQIERIHELGIYPVSQPQHHFEWGEGVVRAIGEQGERFNPLGDFERAGVEFAISSDAPVAYPHPLQAVQAAVSRTTQQGGELGSQDLGVSLDVAIRAHTTVAAKVLGREHEIGSIEVGKRADFVVLREDPYEVAIDQVSNITVLSTWIDGEKAFQRNVG